jgi:hypothetical protein
MNSSSGLGRCGKRTGKPVVTFHTGRRQHKRSQDKRREADVHSRENPWREVVEENTIQEPADESAFRGCLPSEAAQVRLPNR